MPSRFIVRPEGQVLNLDWGVFSQLLGLEPNMFIGQAAFGFDEDPPQQLGNQC